MLWKEGKFVLRDNDYRIMEFTRNTLKPINDNRIEIIVEFKVKNKKNIGDFQKQTQSLIEICQKCSFISKMLLD